MDRNKTTQGIIRTRLRLARHQASPLVHAKQCQGSEHPFNSSTPPPQRLGEGLPSDKRRSFCRGAMNRAHSPLSIAPRWRGGRGVEARPRPPHPSKIATNSGRNGYRSGSPAKCRARVFALPQEGRPGARHTYARPGAAYAPRSATCGAGCPLAVAPGDTRQSRPAARRPVSRSSSGACSTTAIRDTSTNTASCGSA